MVKKKSESRPQKSHSRKAGVAKKTSVAKKTDVVKKTGVTKGSVKAAAPVPVADTACAQNCPLVLDGLIAPEDFSRRDCFKCDEFDCRFYAAEESSGILCSRLFAVDEKDVDDDEDDRLLDRDDADDDASDDDFDEGDAL